MFFFLWSSVESFVDDLMNNQVEVSKIYQEVHKEKYTRFHVGGSFYHYFFQIGLQKKIYLLFLEGGLLKEEDFEPYLGFILGEKYFAGLEISYFEKILSLMGKVGYNLPIRENIALIFTFRYHKDNKFIFTLGCAL